MIKSIFIAGAMAMTNWRLGEREPMKRPMAMARKTERQLRPMKMKKGPAEGLKPAIQYIKTKKINLLAIATGISTLSRVR